MTVLNTIRKMRPTVAPLSSLLTIPLALGLVACAADPPPAPVVAAPPPPPPKAAPAPKAAPKAKKAAPVGIDKRIVEMCNLPTAHFDFDSSSIGGKAKDALEALSACFVTGAGKGKNIRIVGHADPRGETEYNFALGQRRAASVASYLTGAGMPESQITTSSRGELEATGTDADSWRKDRKVDIYLAD